MRFRVVIVLAWLAGALAACSDSTGPNSPQPEEEPPKEDPEQPG